MWVRITEPYGYICCTITKPNRSVQKSCNSTALTVQLKRRHLIIGIKYPYHIPVPKYLGRAIRDVRKRKNMSQGDLAAITGTSVKFISDVERGKETVQMDKVFDLLRALSLQVYLTTKPLAVEADNEQTFDLLG